MRENLLALTFVLACLVMDTDFVPKCNATNLYGLLAGILLSCTGCAGQWCHLPDDCAYAVQQTCLGTVLDDFCSLCPLDNCANCGVGVSCGEGCGEGVDCGCGIHVYEDAVWIDEPEPCQQPVCRRPCIAAGPPPEPYKPPMPPKFLPVPTQAVFSTVNPDAPTLQRGQVEAGYGQTLAFPAGD